MSFLFGDRDFARLYIVRGHIIFFAIRKDTTVVSPFYFLGDIVKTDSGTQIFAAIP